MILHIPGVLSIEGEASQSVALVLDSPHSGTVYPTTVSRPCKTPSPCWRNT